MKKQTANFYLIFFLGIMSLTFSSCEKEESFFSEQPLTMISSDEDLVQEKRRENCDVDYNDMDINIEWAEDCSTARITFSLCCDCLFLGGPETGCTLEPGTLWIQTEECPFDFYTYEQDVPFISIQGGTCYDIVFEVDNKGCDVINISQVQFNGEDLDFDYTSVSCP